MKPTAIVFAAAVLAAPITFPSSGSINDFTKALQDAINKSIEDILKQVGGVIGHLPGVGGTLPLPTTLPGGITLPTTLPGGITLPTTLPGGITLPTTLPGGITLPATLPGGITLPTGFPFPHGTVPHGAGHH